MTTRLLQPGDPPPFELVNGPGRSRVVIACDHAGRLLPQQLGTLGVEASELGRHIAWDLGVAELGRMLSQRLDACLILQPYSRLVIDANRPPGTPESIVGLSERTIIPGNLELSAEQRLAREREIFQPYHDQIAAELERRAAPVLVALHSFTPIFKDVARRWHGGILYGRDARIARPMLAYLRREEGLLIGDNEPYAVSDETDYTVVTHGERRGIAHVEIEVRQDLLADVEGRALWSERLASALEHSISSMFSS
jgi:predicted N-formylglutamate amidohydrolase